MHPTEPMLAFNGDTAGREATYRYAVEIAHRGRRVSIMILPDDHDPASWLAERGDGGLAAWQSGRSTPSLVPTGSLVAEHLAQTKLAPSRRTDNVACPPLRVNRVTRYLASELSAAPVTADEGIPL
jgi:DNA primase